MADLFSLGVWGLGAITLAVAGLGLLGGVLSATAGITAATLSALMWWEDTAPRLACALLPDAATRIAHLQEQATRSVRTALERHARATPGALSDWTGALYFSLPRPEDSTVYIYTPRLPEGPLRDGITRQLQGHLHAALAPLSRGQRWAFLYTLRKTEDIHDHQGRWSAHQFLHAQAGATKPPPGA